MEQKSPLAESTYQALKLSFSEPEAQEIDFIHAIEVISAELLNLGSDLKQMLRGEVETLGKALAYAITLTCKNHKQQRSKKLFDRKTN